jgi:trehalose synthase
LGSKKCHPQRRLGREAHIVNAPQRHADLVVHKSIAEGFGLTVAESMWKGRAVLASRVGGIQDQIVDCESGVLRAAPAASERSESSVCPRSEQSRG